MRDALAKNQPLPLAPLARPGWEKHLWVRPVPPPVQRLPFLSHPRLRRAGALTVQAVAAALEALGDDVVTVQRRELGLRIVVCLMPGCVTYSRRFYEEVLQDPATASPLIFPETVYNAPASHLAAFLNIGEVGYTLVGDGASFLQGLALAGSWLHAGQAQACLVVAAEETDWIVADALRLFTRRAVHASGAGALYLQADSTQAKAELVCVTDAFRYTATARRAGAARALRKQLPRFNPAEVLCLGTLGLPSVDAAELSAWQDWTGRRLSPKHILGEAFTASAAWQCVAACDALQHREFNAANVSVVGANQQAIGARFVTVT
jgi:3-oxoacyl-(acyl-carrier-protein) synthase